MDESQYLLVWAGYLVGALGCFLVWLRMTRNVRWLWLRRLLQMSAVAVLFTPWSVRMGEDELAPALMVSLFDSLLQGPEAFFRAGTPLLLMLGVAWAIVGIYHALTCLLGAKRSVKTESKERMEPNADV